MLKTIKLEVDIEIEKDEEDETFERFHAAEVRIDGKVAQRERSSFETIWVVYDDDRGHDIHLNEGNY